MQFEKNKGGRPKKEVVLTCAERCKAYRLRLKQKAAQAAINQVVVLPVSFQEERDARTVSNANFAAFKAQLRAAGLSNKANNHGFPHD